MEWTQLAISAISALGGGGIGAKLIDLKRERERQAHTTEEAARQILVERLAKVEERMQSTQDRLDKTEEALANARIELVRSEMRIQTLERERDDFRAGYDRLKAELELERQKKEEQQ